MLHNEPSAAIKVLWQKIPINIKVTFFSGFIIGLLTHIFVLTNTLPNSDAIKTVIGYQRLHYYGRWFSVYPSIVSSIFSMPWVKGILSIIYISISACFIVSLVKINKGIYCVLVAGLMVTIPVVAGTFTYITIMDSYFFSLMLACLAATLAERYKYGYIAAIIPIVLSLSIYQSFYSVTVGLLLLILIIEVLNDDKTWEKTVFKGLRFIGTLCASVILYIVVARLNAPSIGLASYQGIDQMGRISLSKFLYNVYDAYKSMANFFLIDSHNFHNSIFYRNFHLSSFLSILFVISALLGVILLALYCIQKKIHKEPKKLLLLIILLLLFPLGCNAVYLMNAARITDLMIYATVLMPVFLLVIVNIYFKEDFSQGKGKLYFHTGAILSCWIIIGSVMLCMFNYWITSNQAYFKSQLGYEQAYAQSVLLISRIMGVDGYSYDTEIVLIGRHDLNLPDRELGMISIHGSVAGNNLVGSNNYVFFLRRYLNVTQKITDLMNGVIEDPEIAAKVLEMPIYPNSGSIIFINDKIYVKFKNL